MISETFGDTLFAPGPEGLTDFPSPEALKRRFIISTKPPKEYLEAKVVKKEENKLKEGKDLTEETVWGHEVTDFKFSSHDDKVLIILSQYYMVCLRQSSSFFILGIIINFIAAE